MKSGDEGTQESFKGEEAKRWAAVHSIALSDIMDEGEDDPVLENKPVE